MVPKNDGVVVVVVVDSVVVVAVVVEWPNIFDKQNARKLTQTYR